MKIYDAAIIGGGPAGLAAAIYAGRAGLSALILEKREWGGQIVITAEIENYPGSVCPESGASLIERMVGQAERFGAERVSDTITDVALEGGVKVLKGAEKEYRAKTVIIAAGADPVKIGCKGEKEFAGKGVSYCATCDAPFFEDLEVYVVGGGDTAVQESVYLSRFARKVTIIHRRDALRAAKSIREKAMADPKINFMWDSVVEEIRGEGLVESMIVRNKVTGERKEIFADADDGTFGIFVFIGFKPHSEIFEGKVKTENGYIVTDENMRTSVPGVFAAGDIRLKTVRQVVTAASDGAIAAIEAGKYIEGLGPSAVQEPMAPSGPRLQL